MANSFELKMINKKLILHTMASGEDDEYTSQSMAERTGLSVATCNNLLAELQHEKYCIMTAKQTNDVGRKTRFYKINRSLGGFTCINLKRTPDGGFKAKAEVMYLFGGVCNTHEFVLPEITVDAITDIIKMIQDDDLFLDYVLLAFPPDYDPGDSTIDDFSDEIYDITRVRVLSKYSPWYMGKRLYPDDVNINEKKKKPLSIVENDPMIIICMESLSEVYSAVITDQARTICYANYDINEIPDELPAGVFRLIKPSRIILTGDCINDIIKSYVLSLAEKIYGTPAIDIFDADELISRGMFNTANELISKLDII